MGNYLTIVSQNCNNVIYYNNSIVVLNLQLFKNKAQSMHKFQQGLPHVPVCLCYGYTSGFQYEVHTFRKNCLICAVKASLIYT